MGAPEAARIRAWESARGEGAARWPVRLAIGLGGLLLAAGVLLFVAYRAMENRVFEALASAGVGVPPCRTTRSRSRRRRSGSGSRTGYFSGTSPTARGLMNTTFSGLQSSVL